MQDTTPNLNYLHKNKGGDYKICYACKTKITETKKRFCPNCSTWIPNFPTSWARSITNVSLLRRIGQVITAYMGEEFDVDNLTKFLVGEGIISVDEEKNNSEEKYWAGGPRRRAAEYAQNMKFLGFANEKKVKNKKITKLSFSGNKFFKSTNKLEHDAVLMKAILSLKLTNQYAIKLYDEYHFRPLLSGLRIVEKLGGSCTLEQFALAFMVTDEGKDFSVALDFATKRKDSLSDLFFNKGKELSRVIQGVFMHWLTGSGLIERKKTQDGIKILITELGSKVLELYENYKPVWYENEEKAADLITEIIKDDKLFKGPDFSFYYDVPDEKKEKVLGLCATKMGTDGISVLEMIDSLDKKQTEKIKETIMIYAIDKEVMSVKISNVFESIKSGGNWEGAVLKRLGILKLEPVFYKDKKIFKDVVLEKWITDALRGGTTHNPDILTTRPEYIMVDAKKNAEGERYKIRAYDGYANHPKVMTPVLIVSVNPVSDTTSRSLKELTKTSVIDANALDILIANSEKTTPESLYKFFAQPEGHGEFIDEERVFNYLKEKVV